MTKFYFLFICLFSFGFLSAQEELSKEEKERRERNIQAANPFAKFGYKAKVATLSKGKYLGKVEKVNVAVENSIQTVISELEKNMNCRQQRFLKF
jgi:hypothetical protein